MNARSRSTEAPMDFQFTSRASSGMKPVWAASPEDPSTPRKRTFQLLVWCLDLHLATGPLDDLTTTTPGFPGSPFTPMFGENRNVPFIFQSPRPQTNPTHPWEPPPSFSPHKTFPQPPPAPELHDVDMSELSPPKPDSSEKENGRVVATGAMRRVFNSRRRARAKPHSNGEDAEDASEGDSEDERGHVGPLTQNTSNHYTLNMPSAPSSRSDTPYVLLG